ncbi:DUF177 domain-containing protein [Bacteroidota bacterium]
MVGIFKQGLKDGEYEIDMDVPVNEVPEMFDEYFGNIHLEGKLRKFGGRYSVIIEADCMAKMICDRSLKEFTEEISVNLKQTFITEGILRQTQADETKGISREIVIHADDKYIDITNEVREIFAIGLPMKRIAPEYRTKNFSELYPEYSSGNSNENSVKIDERWIPLMKLKNN